MSFKKKFIILPIYFLLSTIVSANDLNIPVKLIKAEIDQACSSCASLTGTIQIQNINFIKKVTIVFQIGSDNTWYEIPAIFSSISLNKKLEVWSFSTRSLSNLLNEAVQFAIKYEVDGATYWDNNCNQNYHLDKLSASNTEGSSPVVFGSECNF